MGGYNFYSSGVENYGSGLMITSCLICVKVVEVILQGILPSSAAFLPRAATWGVLIA